MSSSIFQVFEFLISLEPQKLETTIYVALVIICVFENKKRLCSFHFSGYNISLPHFVIFINSFPHFLHLLIWDEVNYKFKF